MNKAKSFFVLALIFILMIGVFVSLGCWQLRRASEKQRLINQSHYSTVQAVSLTQLQSGAKNLEYVPVVVRGYYDSEHTFYLANQFYQHQVGYHVVTPLVLQDGTFLLVDRGWVANKEPVQHTVPAGMLTLHGHLKLPKNNRFIQTIDDAHAQGPLQLMQYDIPLLRQRWQHSLVPFVLLLNPEEQNGYAREWVIAVLPPERHFGYAVQWFALALVSIIIAIILALRYRQ